MVRAVRRQESTYLVQEGPQRNTAEFYQSNWTSR